MIQEICHDIKKLDFAKKHITTAITALYRLTMAASAVEQLQVMASKQKYTEVAAQLEMLLDTQAIKTVLLDIPSLGRQATSTASYSKFVTREMSKAEALLKVIPSPVDSVANTYRALLPKGSPMEYIF
ncbi:hypothetical protein QYF36_021905 [Acer negundo]|nr:hypothetical protein QYF36_021905 [Acer negundo]